MPADPAPHPVHSMPQRPIVIGGCARSGTTLLQSILSAHPAVYAVSRAGANLESHALSRRLRDDTRNLTVLYGQQLHELPTHFSHWCEKTATNIRFVRDILEFFGDRVRFLNVVRDGRDVVTSRHPDEPERFRVPPHRWVNDVSAGVPFDDHPQVMVVHYESLVTDLEPTLRRICAFVDLPFHASLLAYWASASIRRSGNWFHDAVPVHVRSIGRSRRSEFQEVVDRLLCTPGAPPLLAHYGYL